MVLLTYIFPSSRNPDVTYRTKVCDNGAIVCNCPAFRECWHVKTVRERTPIGRTEVTQVSLSDIGAIQELLGGIDDQGAIDYALGLFPSMSLEEARELVEEVGGRDADA